MMYKYSAPTKRTIDVFSGRYSEGALVPQYLCESWKKMPWFQMCYMLLVALDSIPLQLSLKNSKGSEHKNTNAEIWLESSKARKCRVKIYTQTLISSIVLENRSVHNEEHYTCISKALQYLNVRETSVCFLVLDFACVAFK